jgi:uncharacterized membrane protein YhaH (DUF805 family)
MGGAMMTSDITEIGLEHTPQRIPFFTLRGRLGRVRYIVYTLGAVMGAFVFMIAARFGLEFMGHLGGLLYYSLGTIIYFALLPVMFTMFTVRRSHDFNMSGVVALLILVPFVNLLFWFVPGSRLENRYGPTPPMESFGMRLAAGALPVLLVTAFLATAQPNQAPVDPAASPKSTLSPYTP